jgi:hypothetical protein
MLNPEEHKNIHVITSRGEQFGENINTIPVIADELRALAIEYPVCFLKDPNTGRFGLYALTGLEPGQNLYLQNDQWNANYLPLHIRRQPFLMGLTGDAGEQPNPSNTVVTIQLEHKRVTEKGGEALFDEQGNATDFLKKTSGLLANLIHGLPKTDSFIDALIEQGLVEQLQLKVTLAKGEQKSLQGLYGINEESLAAIKGDLLESFYSKGYIQACHMIMASFGHIQKLINWENAR